MNIIILMTIVIVIMILANHIVNRNRDDKIQAFRIFGITAAVIIALFIVLSLMPKAAILIILILLTIMIYKYRNNKIKIYKVILPIAAAIILPVILLNVYEINRFPIILKAQKSYIMNVNEVKKSGSTSIKLKKVLMDLKYINATYSVRGSEKVVAIELKKNLSDAQPLSAYKGLWVGDKILGEHNFIGLYYNANEFIDPIYLVFYLTNGESTTFAIKDNTGVKNIVRDVNIDKKINYDSSFIKLTDFSKGLNYASLNFESNFNPQNIIEVSLIINNSEIKSSSSYWGGGDTYTGSYSFNPVSVDRLQVKIVNKDLNKQDIIDVDLK